MGFLYKVSLGLIICIFSNISLAKDCPADCQLQQIKSYFKAIDKVARKDSTVQDIESLLALTHDDVKYIHVEYEANFDKDSWRKAFNRNLARGAYDNGMENQIRILKTIDGKNHTAIEYSHGIIQGDGSWKQSEPLLVLFGFTDGKISLIKEYW